MNSKSKAVLAVACVMILAGSITYAAWLVSQEITTTMVVKPTVSMNVYDTDGTTPLTEIDMGQFSWDMMKYFPGGTPEAPTDAFYFINNTDQVSFYVDFEFLDLPAGNIGKSVWIKRGDQASFNNIGFGPIYNLPIESPMVNPDPATQYAVWYFALNIVNVDFGEYSPRLVINAYDSDAG